MDTTALTTSSIKESLDRVAVFSTRFLPYSQTFVFDELLHHHRYRAEVFCLERMNEALFPFPDVHALLPAEGILGKVRADLYRYFLYSPRFFREVGQGNFQLIHAHFGVGAQWALPIASRCDLPLVVTLHGFDVGALATRRRYAMKHWRYTLLSSWMLRRTTRFLAASTELAELMIQIGAPPDRVHVYRLGIELPPLQDVFSNTLEVLMVGRLVEKKGFDYGIRAFSQVLQALPSAELTILGDGALRKSLERLAEELGIADKVRFLGAVSHRQVLERMTSAALLLAPSVTTDKGDRESGLMVVKEAAARLVPTVGTLHGGIPEIIESGVTGFLVPERDVAQLATCMQRLLGSPALRQQMGRAARHRMEQEYEIRQRVRVLEEHYDAARREHCQR